MNDDMESLLGRLTPRGMRPELRAQVLTAVASELSVTVKLESSSPWLRRSAWVVAAALLIGIGLNYWVDVRSERALARLCGPPPVSRQVQELASTIAEVTDAQTAERLCKQFTVPVRTGDGMAAFTAYNARVRQMIESLTASKEPFDETLQEDPQVDRNRAGRVRGDRTDCQWHFHLDHRCTA